MPFPANNTDWPLSPDRYNRVAERAVWYAGDPDALTDYYTGTGRTSTIPRWEGRKIGGGLFGSHRSQVKEIASSKFWASSPDNAGEEKVHLPIPEKIAHMSAEALFSDPPAFVVEGPTTTDAKGKVTPTEETRRTQERLDALVEMTGLLATLHAAAETASPLGSVALRIAWDDSVAPYPMVTRSDADQYDPAYTFGVQTETLFWRVVEQNGSETWRHLELHEGGFIYHALYRGTETNLGRQVPLSEHRATAPWADKVNEFGAIFARPGLTTAVSIPNMLPDPMDRRSNVGRSDFTPATIGLFSAIDAAATSLMRDVEDGQSRLLVADYMMKAAGFGKGATFNSAERMFVQLKRQPGDSGNEAPIDQVQFAIRYQEHLAIIADLSKRAIESAGFTPDEDQGGTNDMTATEYVGRNKRTLATRDKKMLYWRDGLARLLTSLLIVDREVFGTQITPMPVRVVFPEAVQESPKVLAETATAQLNADASSRYTRVKTMHPDWDEPTIQEELDRIDQEAPEPIDPGTFGLPAPEASPVGAEEPDEEAAA